MNNLKKLIQQSKSELAAEEAQRKKNQQKLLDQIENEVEQFVLAIQVENKVHPILNSRSKMILKRK